MASSEGFVEFIAQQLIGAGDVRMKRMFGEWGVYLDGKLVGTVCDNQLFVKITDAGRALLGDAAEEAPPYAGAKPYFLIGNLDDAGFLVELVRVTAAEVPEPKPRKVKAGVVAVPKRLKGRSCYGHLGGALGERLFDRFLEMGWLVRDGEKATAYLVTEAGEAGFAGLGVDVFEKRG